jgi:prokaryotic ubiquitin-like protein Pup
MATFIKRLTNRSTTRTDVHRDDAVDPIPLYQAMASGEQKQKNKGGGGDDDEKGEGGQKLEEKGEELKEEMDNLLDEIDSVLEENAEEFVKNYVQRGGQ